MKTFRLFLCLVCAIGSAASAAEHLWQNFDASPTGSVAALPGWKHPYDLMPGNPSDRARVEETPR